ADHDVMGNDPEDTDEREEKETTSAEGEASEAQLPSRLRESTAGDRSTWDRSLDLALAAGYVLRTKAGGWKLFCERLTLPPFALWESMAGYDRLQRALRLAENAAFTAEGFVAWLNRIRPAGEPERTAPLLTVEGRAAAAEKVYRTRVEKWGG